METLYADYSVARPDPKALAATVAAVGRYGSGGLTINGLPKDLSSAEATALHAANLGIFYVWETYAGRPNEGFSAGVADGKAHNAGADALGIPRSVPLFFVGQDSGTPDIPAVVEYFRGIAFVGPRGVGCYGGIDVVNAVAASNWAHWFWQTEAWSGVNISPNAHLYQRATATKPIPGCDENVLIKPFPLWTNAVSTIPNRPVPLYVPPFPGYCRFGMRGSNAVLAFQKRLQARGWAVTVDGWDGSETDKVLRAFQAEKHLKVDGVGGPVTWAALWKDPVT
jgi:peptidoglycan hydrolase-like protein with peptidoglycan-binding domain